MDLVDVPIQVNRRVSPVFADELTLLKREGFALILAGGQRISPLVLEVSTHRLRLYDPQNESASFECVWQAMEAPQPVKVGFFSSQLQRVKCKTTSGFEFELCSAQKRAIDEEFAAMQKAFLDQPSYSLVSGRRSEPATGLKQLLDRNKRDLNQKEHEAYAKMQSLPALFAHFDELLEVASSLAAQTGEGSQKREEIISLFTKIDETSFVSRDSQSNFEQRLSAEIDRVLRDFVERSHGIVPVIEAFSVYNSLRAVDPVTPLEFVTACRKLQGGSALLLEELPTKVLILRLRGLTDESYFAQKLQPLVRDGIDQEHLARKLGVSLSLARVLLDLFLAAGHLCLDNHIEGRVYYPNGILAAGT